MAGTRVHWKDRGFTWIEDYVNREYRITWMANETAKRHSVTFPGEYADYGEPGLGNYVRTAEVIWNNQAIIVYTAAYNGDYRFSTWMIETKSEKVRRLSQASYRMWSIMSPDKKSFALLPDHRYINSPTESLIKIIEQNKPDIDIKTKSVPLSAVWSPDNSMLAYLEEGSTLLYIVDRTGKQLRQYIAQEMYAIPSLEWIAKCLPSEPVPMEP